MKALIALIAIITLSLPPILNQAYSDVLQQERSVTLKITNTKTGIVKTTVWNIKDYTFQKATIDVSDLMVKKIKKIFGTESFSFGLNKKTVERNWLHFKVELMGKPMIVGKGWTIMFV